MASLGPGTVSSQFPLTSTRQAKLLRSVLGELFPDGRLEQLRHRGVEHPAVAGLALLDVLEAASSVPYDDELRACKAINSLSIDAASWQAARRSGKEVDPEAWRQMVCRVIEPSQYENALAELFIWGSLNIAGVPTELTQRSGHADLLIGENGQVAAEVKRLGLGATRTAVANLVKKANKQVRTVNPDEGGALFLLLAREPERAALDDQVPADVLRIVSWLQSLLHPGIYRSIASIYVIWDEFQVYGALAFGSSIYRFRRRCLRVDHVAPVGRPLIEVQTDALEVSRESVLHYRAAATLGGFSPVRIGSLAFSKEYREIDEAFFGVRPAQVVEALANPTARMDIGEDDGHALSIVTRTYADEPDGQALLVLVHSGAEAEAAIVHHALRLWGAPGQPSPEDPGACFLWFLEVYGTDVSAGPVSGRFLHQVRIESEGDLEVMGLAGRSDLETHDEFAGTCIFRFEKEPRPHLVIGFSYAIAYKRYKRAYLARVTAGRRSGNPAVRATAKRLAKRRHPGAGRGRK